MLLKENKDFSLPTDTFCINDPTCTAVFRFKYASLSYYFFQHQIIMYFCNSYLDPCGYEVGDVRPSLRQLITSEASVHNTLSKLDIFI